LLHALPPRYIIESEQNTQTGTAMSSISSVRQLSADLSLTLQQSTHIVMNDVQQGVQRLDRKKEAVARSGVERIQDSNRIAQQLSQQQAKIDTYA
jgi:hypothetical protein